MREIFGTAPALTPDDLQTLLHSLGHGHGNPDIIPYDEEKSCILIVDDLSVNIEVLAFCLGDKYRVSASQDSALALRSLQHVKPNLILLDLIMPELDGFDFCKIVKSDSMTSDIPIVFITAASEVSELSKAFSLGAVDYITKPIAAEEVRARVRTHLRLKAAEEALKSQNQILERKVLERTRKIQEKQTEIEEVQKEAILRLCLAAELRDMETGMHIRRIQEYSALLGRKCGLPEEEVERLHLASAMHDLGKIGIPDSILLKPGKLTPEEWLIMKTHATLGGHLIRKAIDKACSFSLNDCQENMPEALNVLDVAMVIATSHHEKWDGTGYPDGLAGQAIPFPARLMALADVFDALTTPRVYKTPWSIKDASIFIFQQKGLHFDPEVVDAFEAILTEFASIQLRLADE